MRHLCARIPCAAELVAGGSLLFLAPCATTEAAIVYVNASSTAQFPDGTTWEMAWPFLSQGLDDADPDDVVYVAAGTYWPDDPGSTGNRALSFNLKKDVKVLGGFIPGDTLNDRDPTNNLTYLNGDLLGNDDYSAATGFLANPPNYSSMADNSLNIVKAVSTSALNAIGLSTRLDGFILVGGNANSGYDDVGGRGAGLYCGGTTLLTDIKSSPTVAACKFQYNHTTGYAAAVYSSHGDPVLRDLCRLLDNHADACGGATAMEFDGAFTALYCLYERNLAGSKAGAHISQILTDATRFHSCTFNENKAPTTGGALLLVNGGEILNSSFRGNISAEGGAARLMNTTVIASTFSGNQATGTSRPGGGGIYAPSNVQIRSSILWGNLGTGTPLEKQIAGNYSASSSDIDTGEVCNPLPCAPNPPVPCSPVPCTDNINADPKFKTPTDLHLTNCSPCIDKGVNSAVPPDADDIDNDLNYTEKTPDADTHARELNGDIVAGAVIDMGAYEFDPGCPADLNADAAVNGFDLAILLGKWTGAGTYSPCPPHDSADLSGPNCKIDGFDLAILLGQWGACLGICGGSGPMALGGGEGGEAEDTSPIDQLVAWYLAGDMAAIIQWLIEQGY